MSKNFEGMMVGEFYVGSHTKDPPSREEWETILQDCERYNPRAGLFYTEGGSPSALQRKQLTDSLRRMKSPMKGAVLTESRIARVAITAINLFTRGASTAFAPREIDAALTHIGAPVEVWIDLKKALRELNRRLQINGPLEL
jgi:hypothetical protein